VPGVEQLSVFDAEHDRVGVMAFTVAGIEPALVSQVLSVEHGIGVRDGKFCAHLLVDDLLDDPWRESSTTAVRASIGLATTTEAVDRLVGAVRTLAAQGPGPGWTRTTEGWVVDGDDPREAMVTRPW
jgi:selenocysteine lyase/cysteine desulfurase